MLTRSLLAIAIAFVFGIGQIIAQPLDPNLSVKVENEYWGNPDYQLATQLEKKGQSSEARTLYKKALESFEKKKKWEPYIAVVEDLSTSYLESEEYQLGLELSDYTLDKIERKAPKYLKYCQILYRIRIAIYSGLKDYQMAIKASNKELQILREHYPANSSWDFAIAYNRRAKCYYFKKDLNKAAFFALKAKEVAETLGNSNYKESSDNYKLLVRIYRDAGEHEKQMYIMERGLSFALHHPDHKGADLVYYYIRLADLLAELNESSPAIEYLNKALFLIKKKDTKVTAENLEDLLIVYRLLGINYLNLQNPEEAKFYFNERFNLIKEYYGAASNKHLISNLLNISSIYSNYQIKEYKIALEYLNRVDSLIHVEAQNTQDPKELRGYWRSLNWRYGFVWMRLDDLEKSKLYFLKVLKKYPVENTPWDDTGTLFYISLIHEWQGDLDSALYYNQQAIIASCKTFKDPDYLQNPPVGNFRELGNTYWLMNQKARYMGMVTLEKTDEAEKRLFMDKTIEVLDLFDQLHVNKLKKMNLLRGGQNPFVIETSLMPYKSGLSIAHDFYQEYAQNNFLDKGFYYTQKMKAQQLWLTLLKSNATGYANLPKEILEKERDLLADIQHYENKIYETRQMQDSAMVAFYENEYLFEKKEEYREFLKTMESEYKAYFESKYAFAPETGESLKNIMEEGELLVEYVFVDSFLFAFTLSKDQALQMVKVKLAEETLTQIDQFNARLKKSSWMRKSSREEFINLSHALYNQFLKPVEHQLAGKERLIIIGDGMTNYIPFEVLLPTAEMKPLKDLNYLIKDFEISYHYSSSLFAKARKKKRNENAGLFAFAPVYEKEGAIASTAVQPNVLFNSQLRAFTEDGNFAPLPESEREVNAIMKLFKKRGSDDTSLMALRAEANEAKLKENLTQPYRFIHIAGHSFADLDNPKFSGIACYENTEDIIEDGTLYVGEVYNIPTQADLVTLSSCESGYGKLEVTEGLLGLNRAFIYAGTPNVVFSLWKVYDKVSAQLMVDFYKEILSGKDYAASLRQAKLNLLAQEETAAPHFWSPYLLIGR